MNTKSEVKSATQYAQRSQMPAMTHIRKERGGMVSFEINAAQADMILEMSIPELMQFFGCSLGQAKNNRLVAIATKLKDDYRTKSRAHNKQRRNDVAEGGTSDPKNAKRSCGRRSGDCHE